MTILMMETDPTTLATCEHCGADAEYTIGTILCSDYSARDHVGYIDPRYLDDNGDQYTED